MGIDRRIIRSFVFESKKNLYKVDNPCMFNINQQAASAVLSLFPAIDLVVLIVIILFKNVSRQKQREVAIDLSWAQKEDTYIIHRI